MLCLGCLLGSVLINIVRDMMMDGAVILGVPWTDGTAALGWLGFIKGLGDPMFRRVVMDTCGLLNLLLVVYFRYYKQRSCGLFQVREVEVFVASFWEAHTLIPRSSWPRWKSVGCEWCWACLPAAAGESSCFHVSDVSVVASLVVNGYESGTESLNHAASKILNPLGSVTVAHWFTTGMPLQHLASRCTLCTFYTVHGPQFINTDHTRLAGQVNLIFSTDGTRVARIAALFVRDIQILSDLPLKACSEHLDLVKVSLHDLHEKKGVPTSRNVGNYR